MYALDAHRARSLCAVHWWLGSQNKLINPEAMVQIRHQCSTIFRKANIMLARLEHDQQAIAAQAQVAANIPHLVIALPDRQA